MKVVLIGAGNVAHQLGSLMQKCGHEIIQLYNRSGHGRKLAKRFKCDFTGTISKIDPSAEIYIIALKDEAILPFIKKLNFSPALIVHTSGSCNIDVFPASVNGGVLYPVQTFSKSVELSFEEIPFCIEARNEKSLRTLRKFAKSLSENVHVKSSAERKKIHLAAVIVNNFTNHLFTLSQKYLEDQRLPFNILRPLIVETALKILSGNPPAMQTGPARRKDKSVIREHLRMLKDQAELKKIYRLMSDSILRAYPSK